MKKNTARRKIGNILTLQGALLAGAAVSLFMLSANSTFAYETYNGNGDPGCVECHGDFTGSISTKGSVFPSGDKHEMHRGGNYMNADCDLCHTSGDGRDPFIGSSNGASGAGLGCTGCHVAEGLRAHHAINGVTDSNGDSCADCHTGDGTPPAENVDPPYYGITADSNVDNACNDVLASNTNENWTIGDFLGLDNDGDNLYDLADYSCGPLRMVDVAPEGKDLRVRWVTAGGRHEWLQTTSVLTNAFSDVGSSVTIPGVGIVTQEVVVVNGATDSDGFFKVRIDP